MVTPQWQCVSLTLSDSALKNAVESSGASFSPYITSELLELLFTVLHHTNRFVRETGYHVLAAVVSCPGKNMRGETLCSTVISTLAVSQETVEVHWPVVASQIAKGLADNWSQVMRGRCMLCQVSLAPAGSYGSLCSLSQVPSEL